MRPRSYRNWLLAGVLVALTGCGMAPGVVPRATTALEALEKPSAEKFVVVKAQVTKILPKDTQGLTHQNFVVKTLEATGSRTYEINNSTTHGSEVVGLKVGMTLTIKGVVYGRSGKTGIHWTHKDKLPRDAGYIQTPDGTTYE